MSSSSRSRTRSQALRIRDAGLRKVSVVTRVIVAGSIAATGAFAALAGRAQAAPTKRSSARSSVAPSQAGGADVGTSGAGLSSPNELPDPGYQYTSPVVVSGAS